MLSLIDIKLLIVTADINVVDIIDLPSMDALLGKDLGFKVHCPVSYTHLTLPTNREV